MLKRIAIIAAVLAAGCGGNDAGDVDAPDGPPASGTVPGNVIVPQLADGTDLAKVIARRISTVTVTTPVFDEEGNPVLNPDGTQQTITTTSTSETFRYVRNITSATTSVMLPDGPGYTIDIIAAGPAATVGTGATARQVRPVLQHYRAAGATVGGGSVVTFTTVAPPSAPTFSSVYVGLAAPYDTFTATATLAFPFDGTWTMACGGVAGTIAGTRAVFAAPAANVAGNAIACDARFHVGSGFLVAGELANSWEVTVAATAAVLPSSPVPVP
jgi:hypothetical protein